jgi:hypothetical protein
MISPDFSMVLQHNQYDLDIFGLSPYTPSMSYDSPDQFINIDKAQQCFENAIDTNGCRECPHSSGLEQQFHLEVNLTRFGQWEQLEELPEDLDQEKTS